jgi:N-acetylneuraminate synthase/N,N'-diacetyllegionaminate synthase
MQLENRMVGSAQAALVVAELGVNHDGSLARAMELVQHAAECGADAVKLQIFRAAALMHSSAGFADYQKLGTTVQTPIDMLRKYELSTEDTGKVIARVRELKMIPLATPFSPPDLELIDAFKLPAIKIASPDLVNRPLIEQAAALGKPLLISTGAATMEEVETAAGWLIALSCPFALLHCVSAYPVTNDQAHLCWIPELANTFDCVVGYSDHTTNAMSGAIAVAAGASIIEKHLTYSCTAQGPDHAASADPAMFASYVKRIRQAQVLLGLPGKQVLPIEEDVRRVSRQSLVVRRGLKSGEAIKLEDLTFMRPGTGVPAAMLAQTVGRRVKTEMSAGALLHWDMLAEAA